jgi:hypothetical protein
MNEMKLYKKVDGEIRLVDFGMMNCAELYRARGYIVRPAAENDNEAVWKKPVALPPVRKAKKVSFFKKATEFVANVVDLFIPLNGGLCYA